jgi:hypothetical protein
MEVNPQHEKNSNPSQSIESGVPITLIHPMLHWLSALHTESHEANQQLSDTLSWFMTEMILQSISPLGSALLCGTTFWQGIHFHSP